MCKKIFIGATEQHCGKTTTSLSLMHLARKKYARVGFIKPVGPKPTKLRGCSVDKDAALIAEVYGLEDDLELMSPVVLHPGSTMRVLDGEIPKEYLFERVMEAYRTLESKCDFLIIEGAGHGGVGSVLGMSNARVAKELGAPVLLVSGGGIGNVIDAVSLNLSIFEKEGADVRVVMANKLIASKRDRTLKYLRMAYEKEKFLVTGGFNYSPILANPTMSRISKILGAPLQGDTSKATRIINETQLGAASVQRVVDLLQDGTLLVITSSRDELLVTIASLYHIPEYQRKITGIVISGISPVSKITQQIIDESGIPYMKPGVTTAEAFSIITDDVSKITAEDIQKINLIQSLAESEIDFERIDALI